MSIYICANCNEQKDADFNGYNDDELGGAWCDDCVTECPDLFEAMGLAPLPELPTLTIKAN